MNDVVHGHWDTRFDQVADALAEEITYVMNKMGPGTTGTERTNRYARLFYEALG